MTTLRSDPTIADSFAEAELALMRGDHALDCQEFQHVAIKAREGIETVLTAALVTQEITGLSEEKAGEMTADLIRQLMAQVLELGFYAGRAHQANGYSLPGEGA